MENYLWSVLINGKEVKFVTVIKSIEDLVNIMERNDFEGAEEIKYIGEVYT